MPAHDSPKNYDTIPAPEHEHQTHTYAKGMITVLGATRVLIGACLFIAPQFIGAIVQVPVTAQSALLARGFGGRDLALGELLLTANGDAKDTREVKRALVAGLAADILDLGAMGFALASGQLTKTGACLNGGGVVVFVLLGLAGLRSLR